MFNTVYSQKSFKIYVYQSGSLHGAVERGDIDEVKRLINEGENVNKIVYFRAFNLSQTPLHIAAEKGYYDIAELLIQKKANINILNNESRTPLHTASQWGHYDVVQLLLDNNAKKNIKDSKGYTPLHCAVIGGLSSAVTSETLILGGADTEIKNNDSMTPLHTAVYNGNLEAVKVLLANGADANAIDNKKRTPLHYASRNMDDIFYYLEKKFYNKDLISDVMNRISVTKWRSTNEAPSYGANSAFIVEELLKYNADFESKDIEGETPLHYAAFFCNYGAFKVLLDENIIQITNIDVTDNKGYTPLHWAALSMHSKFVKLLFERGGSVKFVNVFNGLTPLHMSASNGRYETSKYLIEQGADVNAKDKKGLLPLDCAKKNGRNTELIKMMEYEILK